MISEIRRQFPNLTNINPVRISGGQKEVFQAVLNGEDVALKLVKVYASDQIRTEREIAAVTKLNSDYVPKIYQTGRCVILSEDRYFIIEQYIHGKTFREILQVKPIQGLNDVLFLADQLLRACSDFEAVQLVHRDIKPENLIISPDGRAWIIDFGFARHLDLSSVTPNGPLGVGTPGYAAPEQFRNLKPQISIKADFFSIGVVLYEALKGFNPYLVPPRNILEILRNMEQQDLPRLSILGDNEGLFSEFIGALSQRFPSRRPQNSAEALDWFAPIHRKLIR